jgi:hypothetical protein
MLELPSLKEEQLPDWAYSCASQQTQDPALHHTQASAEPSPPAEKKTVTRKCGRSAAPKPRRSTPARKKRARHTAAALSHRRPSIDLLEQSPRVLLRRVFPQQRKKQICLWGITLLALPKL